MQLTHISVDPGRTAPDREAVSVANPDGYASLLQLQLSAVRSSPASDASHHAEFAHMQRLPGLRSVHTRLQVPCTAHSPLLTCRSITLAVALDTLDEPKKEDPAMVKA